MKIDFTDTRIAFAAKTDSELMRSLWIYDILQNERLVRIGSSLTELAIMYKLPVNSIIKKTIYKQFCGGETVADALKTSQKLRDYGVHTVLDYAAEGGEDEEDFDGVLQQVLTNLDIARKNPVIDCISMKLTGIGNRRIFEKITAGDELLLHELDAFSKIEERLDLICQKASEAGIIVYIDAEESWLQAPIDKLAEAMMQKYNKEKPLIFNTLQMYRTDRLAYCKYLVEHARLHGYIAGLKLVRGAYHEKEAVRAREFGYPNPILPSKEAVDKSFNAAIDICLDHLDICAVCAATHNEESIAHLIEEAAKLNLLQEKDRILFSQLYGMSDNLSFNLAKAGWHASKYLPYGDVKTTIPYLLRRAKENTSIVGQMSRELSLLRKELNRRKALATLR